MFFFCRNNNISSLNKIKHPKKQPVSNIRRRVLEANIRGDTEKIISKLSIDEKHRQRRKGAGEFLDESIWKR